MKYDYVIIGGGPCGLTTALYLSKIGKKCCIIDKNKTLGGCHRVTRVEGLFTEHGPRIYSSAYLNFKQLLTHLETDFEELFTRYKFNISSIQNQTLSNFTIREKLLIGKELLELVVGTNKQILEITSVKDYAVQHKFTQDAQDYMDRLCRLTDGAGYDKYTMYQFLQLINQNFFYNLYQPKFPNDIKLFLLWEQKLLDQGVDIYKNNEVRGVHLDSQKTVDIREVGGEAIQTLETDNVVCCIPPKQFMRIAPYCVIDNWGVHNRVNMREWSEFNSYINDIPISFHWDEKIKLPKVWGFPKDDWGVAFIVLTDYMNADMNKGTVISTCVTKQNSKSRFTNKTMHESNEKEIIEEVFRQLKLSFPDISMYNNALIHPNVKRVKDEWVEDDTAFVNTYKARYVKSSHPSVPGFYFVGTQNGLSYYNFTSMESAITNAMFFVKELEPERFKKLEVHKPTELVHLLRIMLVVIILMSVYYFTKDIKSN